MRSTLAVVMLLFAAVSGQAADPVYIDELVETPLARLQATFSGLRKEGCYQIAEDRFLLVTIDKKDLKPWRVVLTSMPPCRRPEPAAAMDVRERAGISLGESQVKIVERMGRPDTAAPPEAAQRRLGDIEYFYICKITEGCARHTSVYVKDGVVSAIAEWYSE